MCEFNFYLENKDKLKELISTQRQCCWDVKDMKERGNEKSQEGWKTEREERRKEAGGRK